MIIFLFLISLFFSSVSMAKTFSRRYPRKSSHKPRRRGSDITLVVRDYEHGFSARFKAQEELFASPRLHPYRARSSARRESIIADFSLSPALCRGAVSCRANILPTRSFDDGSRPTVHGGLYLLPILPRIRREYSRFSCRCNWAESRSASIIIPVFSGKSESLPITLPLTVTVPLSGFMNPQISFKSTVLPLPLSPTMPYILPSCSCILTSSRTVFAEAFCQLIYNYNISQNNVTPFKALLFTAPEQKKRQVITATSANSTAAAVLTSVSCFAMPYAPSMAKLKLFSFPHMSPVVPTTAITIAAAGFCGESAEGTARTLPHRARADMPLCA